MDIVAGLFAFHPFWAWLGVGAILLAIEVATGSGYLLWPAASAGVTSLLTGFHFGLPVELAVFAALTIVSTLVARRYLPHPFRAKGPDINDPHLRIVGRRGRGAGAFAEGHGRVFVDGKEWAAELEDGGDLPPGADLTITGVVSGGCLKVRRA